MCVPVGAGPGAVSAEEFLRVPRVLCVAAEVLPSVGAGEADTHFFADLLAARFFAARAAIVF